jgi:hypothetical protein
VSNLIDLQEFKMEHRQALGGLGIHKKYRNYQYGRGHNVTMVCRTLVEVKIAAFPSLTKWQNLGGITS